MRSVRLTDGLWFRSGQKEIVIGKAVAKRYPTAKLRFDGGISTIPGGWPTLFLPASKPKGSLPFRIR
jgi:hypothetical protein